MCLIDDLKNQIICKISEKFSLKKCEIGKFSEFSYPKLLPITKYMVDKYDICGLGNMTVLQSRTFNLMNLLTVVLTPDSSKNIPFVLIDFVIINNKCISFFEFFDNHTNSDEEIDKFKLDIIKIKEKYKDLEDYVEKPKWYVPLRATYSLLKQGKKNKQDEIIHMIIECLEGYLSFVSKAEKTKNIISSREKLASFIDDLINKGNPSSKPISKALGKAQSEKFFRNVVFYIK